MNRFFKLKGKKALMPFLMLGDPNFEDSLNLIQTAIEAGVDALELGIPFSDPLADGPIIQAASERALQNGMTFKRALELIARIRAQTEIPIAVLTYTNLIYRQGFENGLRDLHHAGVDALLLADLPIIEALKMQQDYVAHQMGQIFLIAQNTNLERAHKIHQGSTGFTYLVNAMGTTGLREGIPAQTLERLAILKQKSNAPIFVGFGIHQKAQVEELWNCGADGVIVGSRVIDLIAKAKNMKAAQEELTTYLKGLR